MSFGRDGVGGAFAVVAATEVGVEASGVGGAESPASGERGVLCREEEWRSRGVGAGLEPFFEAAGGMVNVAVGDCHVWLPPYLTRLDMLGFGRTDIVRGTESKWKMPISEVDRGVRVPQIQVGFDMCHTHALE